MSRSIDLPARIGQARMRATWEPLPQGGRLRLVAYTPDAELELLQQVLPEAPGSDEALVEAAAEAILGVAADWSAWWKGWRMDRP
jgi:hypothetical protein